MSDLASLRDLGDNIEHLAKKYEHFTVSGMRGVDLDEADKQIDAIVKAGVILKDALTVKPSAPTLSSADRSVSFTNAIEKIAATLRGGVVMADESFLEAVIRFARNDHAEFWAMQPAGLLRSLLDNEKSIISFLAAKGIQVWIGDDARVRIVNANWQTDPTDIHAFVTAPAPVGRTCRFCATVESDDRQILVQHDDRDAAAQERMISNMHGHDMPLVATGLTNVHPQCLDHWVRWIETARAHRREFVAKAAGAES